MAKELPFEVSSIPAINNKAGQLRHFLPKWRTITSDKIILSFVEGVKIEFVNEPLQARLPRVHGFEDTEKRIINDNIMALLSKGVIEQCSYTQGQFVSTIFLRPKKDGSHRFILNLKNLNRSVEYKHFKMETLENAKLIMRKNCYMATVDLKEAYYSVPVHKSHRKYLRFQWGNKFFQFTCLPNGLASAPRMFTKILKPVYSNLRSQGLENVGFIDDTYLQGDTIEECANNMSQTKTLFKSLGFTINEEKSSPEPKQEISFLGYWLNSKSMTVSLTESKAENIVKFCTTVLSSQSVKIREVAQLVGLMVAYSHGVMYAPLFYHDLEREKTQALMFNKGNFDATMKISDSTKGDINWWILNAHSSCNPLDHGAPDITIYSDASLSGWGGVCNGLTARGIWSHTEKQYHINYLEIFACFLVLKSLCSSKSDVHIRCMIDNTTAIAYVNKMGGTKQKCNEITKQLWLWCIDRNIWLSASHIPGKENVIADKASREKSKPDLEWKLNPKIFDEIVMRWGHPDVDLFASRLNHQILPYVSWKPDPDALAIDAFSISWGNKIVYIFPPFALINRILKKIEEDQTKGILIIPYWTTQVWFPRLTKLLIKPPILLPQARKTLVLPSDNLAVHPLITKMRMLACYLSGIPSESKAFLKGLQTSSCNRGEMAPGNNIQPTCQNGLTFAVKGTLIPLEQVNVKL